MTASLPRVRGDLTTSRQVTSDGVVFVVKDPVRDRFYRLPEEAYFIVENLDGETPLDIVRERVEAKFQTPLLPAQLAAFIGDLKSAGLLDSGENLDGKRRRARRIQGNVLYLRVRFFDPDRLFNFLIPKIRFFFTPAFMVLSAATILWAIGVACANWAEAVQNLSRVFQYSALPFILLVVFVVITGHEFAHGLTCKHFGGEVHELGFFLIYLQPALYCNVSDAWLFSERSKRLWVGFAGPYFELFLWAVATIAWRVTDPETWINYVAFIVMTTSGIKTLFNFNPLIKLDGYYLLSDWLEIPNLRKKGFACFGDVFRRLFGAKAPHLEQLSPRERRVCLLYGIVAGVGSLFILGYAIVGFGGLLVQQGTPVALATSAWFLGMKIRRRYQRMAGNAVMDPDDPDSTDADPVQPAGGSESREQQSAEQTTAVAEAEVPPAKSEATAASESAPAVPTAPPTSSSKRKRRRWRAIKRGLGFLVLGGTAAAALFYIQAELRIKGPFDVLPVKNADVRAAVEGLIAEVTVQEGQAVQEGELIARLFDRDVRADLTKTEAAIEETQAKLKLLLAGPRQEEIEQARIEVDKDVEAINYAVLRLDRDKALLEGQLISRKEEEESELNLAQRKSDLAEAKSKLDVLKAGSRPEEIDAMRAALASLQTQRAYLEEQLRLMRVVSPAAGIVATPARQLMEMKHQLVKKGDLIAKVFELKTITAEMIVSERDIADVQVGQQIVLKARAYPEKTFHGKVTAIAIAAQSSQSSSSGLLGQSQNASAATTTRSAVAPKTLTITSEIDNDSLLLKPEMTGQAKISCGKRQLWQLLTRRLARTFKVEFWSWW
jgi:multidrug resistance efflux pump